MSRYDIGEIIDRKTGEPSALVQSIIPKNKEKRLGQRKEANKTYVDLKTPDWKTLAVPKGSEESCMKRVGEFLLKVVEEYVVPFLSAVVLELMTW